MAMLFINSVIQTRLLSVDINVLSDKITAYLHEVLPITLQVFVRNSGLLRAISDNFVALAACFGAITQPYLVYQFFRRKYVSVSFGTKGGYLQIFDLVTGKAPCHKMLIFVHGGAWGVGKAWHYRVTALEYGTLMQVDKVVLIGYPTFPDTTIREQADIVLEAIRFMEKYGMPKGTGHHTVVALMGHSSGANISALALLKFAATSSKEALLRPYVDVFYGLSGVYDIHKHFQFEKARGVHVISPMGAAAEGIDNFTKSSPTLLLEQIYHNNEDVVNTNGTIINSNSGSSRQTQLVLFPYTILLHGSPDYTVPHSSSEEFANILKRLHVPVDLYIMEKVGHMDPIINMLYHDSDTTTNTTMLRSWENYQKQVMNTSSVARLIQ